MSKRYMFWRKPDGKPYTGTDDKFAPTALLAELGNSASINEEGNVQWHGLLTYLHFETAVRAIAIILDPDNTELNAVDTGGIVHSALVAVIKKSKGRCPIAAREFVEEANRAAAEFFRRSPKSYYVVSSLSMKSFPARQITLGSFEIVPLRDRGKRFPLPLGLRYTSRESPVGKHFQATNYQTVRVQTNGRSYSEAVEKGIDAINLLRGLWNLFITFGYWNISFGSTEDQPLGAVHLGPIHTLHALDGALVDDCWWYEPNAPFDRQLFVPKDGWESIEKNRRWALRQIRRRPYCGDLQTIIRRYASALDQTDRDVAFLMMWGVLESITDTVGQKYDDTIRRATWFFKDREVANNLLASLRLRRNLFVHTAKIGDDRDQVAYLIKSFIEPHLMRLIRNDFGIASLKEYGEYLDLPTDVGHLESERRVLGHAIRTLKKWNKQA